MSLNKKKQNWSLTIRYSLVSAEDTVSVFQPPNQSGGTNERMSVSEHEISSKNSFWFRRILIAVL